MRLAACILGFLVGGLNLVQGAFRIPQCSAHGGLEIRADQTAADVTCTGFCSWQTIKWQLIKNNNSKNVTCDASGRCTNPSNDLWAVRPDRGTTRDLHINRNHRTLAGHGVVKCGNPNVTSSAASCRTNVISPAVLTHCELSLTTGGTVAGTCNFTNAYSSNYTYSCTWILTPLDGQGDPDAVISGHIQKTSYTSSSNTYYKGTCSFPLSWFPAGQYNYTVRFLPGGQYQGTGTVPAPPPTSVLPSTATISTSAPLPSVSTDDAIFTVHTVSTEHAVSTVHTVSTEHAVSTVHTVSTEHAISTVHTVSTDYAISTVHTVSTVRTAADQSSSTEAYIAGGVVAAVVVIVAVVVVVLVRRYLGRRLYDRPRRRRQLQRQPEENPYTGLNVYEAVGQPAPVTPPTPDTAQSVYEIPDQDQETVPSVKISQSNTAFTSDIGDGYSTCVESQPYENDSRTDSSRPYRNVSTPSSSHPYKNDFQSGPSSKPYENDHQACDANHPYNNENPPDSSQPYENVNLSDPSKPAD